MNDFRTYNGDLIPIMQSIATSITRIKIFNINLKIYHSQFKSVARIVPPFNCIKALNKNCF